MLAALRLQMEWGADEALLDEPVDRFARMAPVVPNRVPPLRPTLHPVARPAATAIAANDLAGLHAEMDALAHPLRATASHTVGPAGNQHSGLLLIGEAPGPDDDRSGQAFSGPAGATMDRVLASAGLSREQAMLAFLVPWRPPGGRKPTESEIAFCLPYLHRLLLLVRPRRTVLMSGLALRALTGDAGGVRRGRGRWTAVTVPGADPIPALPMPPPELWLSSANAKSATWADLLALRAALDA